MDGLSLTENARKVLEARYLKKDESGRLLETPADLFRRVARVVAESEIGYGVSEDQRRKWEGRFYRLMSSGAFMPNSPTLMNAGREMGMLSACFVLPVRDSIVDIFNSIKHTALIQKAGGGTGFAFDELRPTGDFIKSSGGTTSGPISFWRAFSEATNAIQQGAFRRGANMGMMYIHHPDILKFLHAKQDLNQFTNYNISVKVTDSWMEEFLADPDSPHVVRNPRNGRAYVFPRNVEIWKYTIRDLPEVECVEPVPPTSRATYFQTPRMTGPLPEELRGKVYTKGDIWNIIVENAWQTGEPGVVFIDRINRDNPTPLLGRIEATNPCGEQPLLPYEACNLGSLNLGHFVRNACQPEAEVDWAALAEATRVATRFLDDVIDANNYPLPEIERMCRDNRKIGLGVMGFADALFKLGVAYNSEEGIAWGERFMKFVNEQAHQCSEELARQRGCFPNWTGSVWHTRHNRLMRNAAVTTVAPTGTISIIADCSGGIEPLYSLAFVRNVLRGQLEGDRPLIEVNEVFRQVALRRGFYSEELIDRVAREGTLANIPEVPADVKRVFVCARDIAPEWHIQMQAAFQRHCDASISKTINFPAQATRQDVDRIYRLAYQLDCKGVTVYRDQCRACQPMSLKGDEDWTAGQCDPPEQTARNADCDRDPPADPQPTDVPSSPAVTVPSDHPPYIEPMDLPEIVSGLRIRQMTPFGNMHVKITVDPRFNRELEVFAQLGKGGDVATSDLEAICRLISLWLRSGGSLHLVIKQLEGIGSSLQIPTRSGRITSLADGLACALKKYARAKERFGLRQLLLGEIDLSELDSPVCTPRQPNPAPSPKPSGPGGNGGRRQAVGHVRPAAAADQLEIRAGQSALREDQAQPPKALHVEGGNGNGGGNGHDFQETAVAVVDSYEVDQRSGVAADLAQETETAWSISRAEKRSLMASQLSDLLVNPQPGGSLAGLYKLRCPECGEVLALQEGCSRCSNPACGWAAC